MTNGHPGSPVTSPDRQPSTTLCASLPRYVLYLTRQQGGWLPFWHTTVVPFCGTTTVVFAGAGGLLLLTQPLSRQAATIALTTTIFIVDS